MHRHTRQVRRKRWPMIKPMRAVLLGGLAGAAGTSALNTVTYLDMAVRGRPASSTPEDTVRKLADRMGVTIPGDSGTRANRVAGLGPLTGHMAGAGPSAGWGWARAFGGRPAPLAGTVTATIVVVIGTNGPMTALGITDPRTWPVSSWITDVVPHLAYAA